MEMLYKLKISSNKLEASTKVCEKLETNTSHFDFWISRQAPFWIVLRHMVAAIIIKIADICF